MRSILLFVVGALAGVVGVIMLQTLDSDGSTPPVETSGGGNARMSLDQSALVALMTAELGEQVAVGTVEVKIEPSGVLVVSIRGVAPPEAITGDVTLDPDLEEGKLVMTVREIHGAVPPLLVEKLQENLRERLKALAGTDEYRVTAITTAANRLEIEIKL